MPNSILLITDEYQSEEDNLSTLLIENLPEFKFYRHLTITFNTDSNKNPFPKTKYIFEIRNTGTEKV